MQSSSYLTGRKMFRHCIQYSSKKQERMGKVFTSGLFAFLFGCLVCLVYRALILVFVCLGFFSNKVRNHFF